MADLRAKVGREKYKIFLEYLTSLEIRMYKKNDRFKTHRNQLEFQMARGGTI